MYIFALHLAHFSGAVFFVFRALSSQRMRSEFGEADSERTALAAAAPSLPPLPEPKADAAAAQRQVSSSRVESAPQ